MQKESIVLKESAAWNQFCEMDAKDRTRLLGLSLLALLWIFDICICRRLKCFTCLVIFLVMVVHSKFNAFAVSDFFLVDME